MPEDIEFDSEKAFREASNQSLQSLKRARPREKPTRLPEFKVGEMDRKYSTMCAAPISFDTLCHERRFSTSDTPYSAVDRTASETDDYMRRAREEQDGSDDLLRAASVCLTNTILFGGG